MEIAVGFHSLKTTTQPPNVNLPSSGQQVTSRLSARKFSDAGGEQGPKLTGQGNYKCNNGFPLHVCRDAITIPR